MSARSIVASVLAISAAATALSNQLAAAVPSGVPQYVVKYAPITYLYSGEKYFPSDLATQLKYTTPEFNFTTINGAASSYTLDNLNQLNKYGSNGTQVYLTSKTPEYNYPAYFGGVKPDAQGQTNNAYSSVVIVNDLGQGNVIAFYWYFYAFNFGGTYFEQTIDDHVGDWEYNAVRFANGLPTQVWYSQHSYGTAYTYNATAKYKNGPRPINYSANGTHANYATAGTHEIKLTSDNIQIPGIDDHTDDGFLWDPTLQAYWYSYNNATQKFAAYSNAAPVNWLYFNGQFGNQQLPTSDSHQSCIFDITELCQWTSGPPGPLRHTLSRATICPNAGNCPINNSTSSDS